MSQTTEYAKIAKVTARSYSRGFQTTLKLPDTKTVAAGGLINFYVGLDHAECGISCREGGWRWFANSSTEGQTGGNFGEFSNGQTVNIKLTIDDAPENGKYYMRFYVNNVEKRKFATAYTSTSSYNNARLVIGSVSNTYNPMPNPLPAWNLWHTQLTASGMMYKTAASVWTNVTSSNVDATKLHWPVGITPPAPVDYIFDTISLNSGTVYASLKKDLA